MKIKLFCLFLALCALAGLVPVSAEAHPSSQEILASVVKEAGCSEEGEWIEKELLPLAGGGGEDFAYALLGMDKGAKLFSYLQKGRELLSSDSALLGSATRQNLALVLYLGGEDPSSLVAANGEGVMSDVLSLLLFSRGLSSDAGVQQRLLEQQLPDGGWSLRGGASDVDVTAMALRALAVSGKTQEDACVKRALSFLQSAQLPDGTFLSYGVSNCESTAQVLIVLCALGIDPDTDPRFMKDSLSLTDALFSFYREGGFCHTADGAPGTIATGQGLLAAVCRERFFAGKSPLWAMEPAVSSKASSTPVTVPSSSAAAPAFSYRVPATVVVLLLILLAGVVLVLKKKTHLNNFLFVFLCGALLIWGVWGLDFRSSEEYYASAEEGTATGEVLLSVRCDTLCSVDAKGIPQNGVILDCVPIPLMEGDTVYDVLVRGAKLHRLRLEIKGNGALCYIGGIQEIRELQFGELSGWMFFVNGEESGLGCAEVKLCDGDLVEWKYTLQLGKDL